MNKKIKLDIPVLSVEAFDRDSVGEVVSKGEDGVIYYESRSQVSPKKPDLLDENMS